MKKTPHTLDLLFVKPSKDDLPGPARSRVFVKNRGAYSSGDSVAITPESASFKELSYWIDQRREELETLRKSGRSAYAAHDRQQAEAAAEPPASQTSSPLQKDRIW